MNEDIIPAEVAVTLHGLFVERVRRTPDSPAYRAYDPATREWRDSSWREIATEVAAWQAAMAAEDLQAGDRVAILMRNRKEWVVGDQAALGLGLVVVPLYTDDRPDNIAYILNDAAVKLLIVQDVKFWRRLSEANRSLRQLERVVVLEGEDDTEDDRVRALGVWLGDHPPAEAGDADAHDLASIVYTSGTTGKPKGVMLSHHNMLSIAYSGLKMYSVYTEDVLLSFLPLSHTFERTVGYYLPIMAGATVAYARSIPQLAEDLQSVRPTALIAVPRIFERVYARLHQQMEKKSPVARWLFRSTVDIGWRRFMAEQGRGSAGFAGLLWPLLDRLVASKVRERLGGRLRLTVAGGAALPPTVARLFCGLGIPITQGYGMTETSPIISGNPPGDNDPASVGVPLKDVEVRIGENDELQVKTPGMMLGYWNNHAATREMIGADGWLHTGDQARIDEFGHIHITGRIKDILVLSNGEKVPPSDMEMAITLDPLFEQVMVIGEGQAFLAAIVVLNPEEWVKLANKQVIDPYAAESLGNEKIKKVVARRISDLLSDFPGYAKIRKVILSLDPWTVDNGLLTPTLKVKRPQVLALFADKINAVFQEKSKR